VEILIYVTVLLMGLEEYNYCGKIQHCSTIT